MGANKQKDNQLCAAIYVHMMSYTRHQPHARSGTRFGRWYQAGQAELAWTGGGFDQPPPPPSPTLRACMYMYFINLLAAYLSQTLQANTIQVYQAAISHLHLTHGFSSPVHNNPTLNLAIRGIQHSQGPAHLRPKRLPLTIGMLEQLLRLLEADPLSRHDKLMLKAALTFGFFGFLRVSEYTLTNRGRFDPTLHPTKSDITWVKDGMHFFIKKSKTDQVGRGTTIAMDHTHRASCPVVALQAYFEDCKAPPGSSLFHSQTGRPLTSRAMRAIL